MATLVSCRGLSGCRAVGLSGCRGMSGHVGLMTIDVMSGPSCRVSGCRTGAQVYISRLDCGERPAAQVGRDGESVS